LEKDFKSEIITVEHNGRTCFKSTQPTPILVERHEWKDIDETSGKFNPEVIINPYRLANQLAEEGVAKTKGNEKKAATEIRKS
jgi:hypothetical protein